MTIIGDKLAAVAAMVEAPGGIDQMEAVLREVTHLESDHPPTPAGLVGLEEAKFHEVLGGWALARGRAALALSSHRRMLELEREGGESPIGLAFSRCRVAKALAATGELDAAEAEFQAALDDLTAADAPAQDLTCVWIDYGNAMMQAERLGPAVKALREAVASAEGQPPSLLGNLYHLLGKALKPIIMFHHTVDQLDGALRNLGDMADEVTPVASELSLYAGKSGTFQKEGEHVMETALEHMRAAGYPELGLTFAKLDLAEIYGYGARHDRAATLYREALASCEEVTPDFAQLGVLYHKFGESLYKAGVYPEALRVVERALAKKTATDDAKKSLADSWQLLGEIQAISGERKKALEAYQEAAMLLDPMADADQLARVQEAIATLSGSHR